MAERSPRYTSVAIALHWAIALAILFLIWLGWNMHENEARYQLHKSIGITILILTLARIIWRGLNPPPPLPDDMNGLEKTASHLVHVGFYVLMLAMPLTGWLYVSTAYEFDVPTVLFGVVSWPDIPGLGFLQNETANGVIGWAHGALAWLTLVLLALHIGGALKHEFSAEEGVLKRMIPGLFGKTEQPKLPPRGFAMAFGAAFGVFALIAGSALIPSATPVVAASPAQTDEANWEIDYEASSIFFSGVHDGDEYSGGFENWSASIVFDPENLAAAKASVTVATGSARANKKLYTDSLSANEWLASGTFPTATVLVDAVQETEAGYTANATLTLKDITVTVPFEFALAIDGDTAIMDGQATVFRTPLDLGMSSDPGADWVDEAIQIEVHVEASRK